MQPPYSFIGQGSKDSILDMLGNSRCLVALSACQLRRVLFNPLHGGLFLLLRWQGLSLP
jgi:hypothetical protein